MSIAVANIDGHTIHSTFNYSFIGNQRNAQPLVADIQAFSNLCNFIIEEAQTCIQILLGSIDARLMEQFAMPIGGIHILFCRDQWLQLRPIVDLFFFTIHAANASI